MTTHPAHQSLETIPEARLVGEGSPLHSAYLLCERLETLSRMNDAEGELTLEHVNTILGLYGVECARLSNGHLLYYVNRGDSYAVTITFKRDRLQQFKLEAWGDVVEAGGLSYD